MPPAKHALLGASKSDRWLQCTPSARLEDTVKDKVSPYAAEGSLAHELAEKKLRYALGEVEKTEAEELLSIISEESRTEMDDATQTYVDYVLERWEAAKLKSPDALLLIEEQLDFSKYVPEAFGTSDAVIIADGLLEVIDLKYGKGIQIFAEGNPQARLYALGALEKYKCLYEIGDVISTFVQPRLDSISDEKITADELIEWAEEYVTPRAKLAFEGKGEFVSGDHCQFCKVKVKCRKRAEETLSLAKHAFAEPALLSDDDIEEILEKAKRVAKWVKDLEEYAFAQALSGKTWRGFKLVEGRSTRKYVSDKAVASTLIQAGYAESEIFEAPKVKGITAMTKVLGKKNFDSLLSETCIIKPQGAPTLVPVTDKRPELTLITPDEAFQEED